MKFQCIPHHIDGRSKRRSSAPPPSYTGGRTYYTKDGYILEKVPGHPNATDRDGLVLQHRLVASCEILGRPLRDDEYIHHIDGDKTNNYPENLQVVDNAEHAKLHSVERGDIDQYPENVVAGAVAKHGLLKAAKTLKVATSSILLRYPYLRKIKHLDHKMVQRAARGCTTLQGLAEHLEVSPGRLRKHYPDLVPRRAPHPDEEVRTALRGRTTKEAAEHLGVSVQTMHNRYGHLLKKRKSPLSIDDPLVLKTVRLHASDPSYGVRDLRRDYGISPNLARRVCRKHGVEWKSYRGPRKKTTPKE